MERRRIKLIEDLRAAREELLNINFATTAGTITYGNASRPYGLVLEWLDKWNATFNRYAAFSGELSLNYNVEREMRGYHEETDIEIFNEMRPTFVGFIDRALSNLDQTHAVKPVLADYIKRVQDTKLAVLLNEFNAVKDIAPNLAAIGFRTILSLIIQEKAKRVNPTSNAATATDLAPGPMLSRARNENILSPDEQRLVDSFEATHRGIYDLVTHRPNVLVDVSEVDTMVDLLNKLLPSIIN